jgi:hypothetical protein
MRLKLRAGPDRYFWDAQFRGGRANLVATLGRDTAAALPSNPSHYVREIVRVAKNSHGGDLPNCP